MHPCQIPCQTGGDGEIVRERGEKGGVGEEEEIRKPPLFFFLIFSFPEVTKLALMLFFQGINLSIFFF